MSAPVGSDRPFLNRRLAAFGTTIFAEMSALAARTGSINLGQGFPDTDGPAEIAEAASRAVLAGLGNQYPPGPGVPELRTAIASHQQRFYGLGYDPDTEVLVTAGATEAIAASLLALLEPGDEVIALEPFYDSYAACIAMAGATRVPVTLRPHGDAFALDLDELRAAVTPRTRLLLLNTPHNPTGTVLTPAELAAVAALAVERDLLVVTDEVYEHLVFEGSHTPGGLPRHARTHGHHQQRGQDVLVHGLEGRLDHRTAGTRLGGPLGEAVPHLRLLGPLPVRHRRGPAPAGRLLRGLPRRPRRQARPPRRRPRGGRLPGLPPARHLLHHHRHHPLGEKDGLAFCRALPERCGVVAIPNQVFYDDKSAGATQVRWAFCKKTEVLEEAADRLRRL